MSSTKTRREWISELSQADGADLAALWSTLGLEPKFTFLRPPEIGAVMTRGRVGADSAPFNLGEATATRCSVRLDGDVDGHSYALGRDKRKAEIAALCDALMQTDRSATIAERILAPLAQARRGREAAAAKKAAATKVEFFTMTRGDD